MKLNIPDMKSTTDSASGSRGPEKPQVTQLDLIENFDHVHTIHDIARPYAPAYMPGAEGKE